MLAEKLELLLLCDDVAAPCTVVCGTFLRASCMPTRLLMSCWLRLTTAIHPFFSCTWAPVMISRASVPGSMMSSLVNTPIW